jgi:hypothetical protein
LVAALIVLAVSGWIFIRAFWWALMQLFHLLEAIRTSGIRPSKQ